jgi:hypothetical protein
MIASADSTDPNNSNNKVQGRITTVVIKVDLKPEGDPNPIKTSDEVTGKYLLP